MYTPSLVALTLVFFACAYPETAIAFEDTKTKGFVGLSSETYRVPAKNNTLPILHVNVEAHTEVQDMELALHLETRQALKSGDHSAFDIREISLATQWNNTHIKAGIDTIFWGVTEARHLVDIMNQSDYRFDPDGQVKLGQVMLQTTREIDNLTLSAYVSPCYRERAYPSPQQYHFHGNTDEPISSVFVRHHCGSTTDRAIRGSLQQGPLDLGMTYFYGHSREPVRTNTQTDNYPLIHHMGIDGQWTSGAWLWKLEAITQRNHTSKRHASVAGFEYTAPQLISIYDLGFLYEHLQDTQCTPFACGDMLGVRVVFNNESGGELLLTRIHDTRQQENAWRLETRFRLDNNMHLGVELRHNALDQYGQIKLNYMF